MRDWCLFLDVDGTLLEIAATPSGVIVDEALKSLLVSVARRLDGALALVSGRSIAALDALFAPLEFPAAGQHGAERRSSAGMIVDEPSAVDRRILERVRADLKAFVDDHPGTLLEDKGHALAIHFRQAPEHEAAAGRALLVACTLLEPHYQIQPGSMVLELLPRGIDKASALAAFMRETPFSGRTPVFVGDDLTDEPALRFAERVGGVSIAVGGRIDAQWRLDGPREVRHWLGTIAALESPQARS